MTHVSLTEKRKTVPDRDHPGLERSWFFPRTSCSREEPILIYMHRMFILPAIHVQFLTLPMQSTLNHSGHHNYANYLRQSLLRSSRLNHTWLLNSSVHLDAFLASVGLPLPHGVYPICRAMYVCIALYVSVWLCMAIYCYVWLCMAMYVYVWPSID